MKHIRFSFLPLAPLLLATAVWFSISACAINPVTRRPRLMSMTEREEEKVGRRAASELAQLHGVIDSGPLADYLSQLGQQLAAIAPGPSFDYRFFILDSSRPNAYAFPGGDIFISRGLLALLKNEDELAGILGHEISHAAMRHASTRLFLATPMKTISSILASPVELISDEHGERLEAAVAIMFVAPYNRVQEREADRVGAALAASWGYDVTAFGRALRRLSRFHRHRGTAEQTGWLASHPPTKERLEQLAFYDHYLQQGKSHHILTDGNSFLRAIDGLLVGPNPQRGTVRDNSYMSPAKGMAMDFPESWSTQLGTTGPVSVSPLGQAFLNLFPVDIDSTGTAPIASDLEGAKLRPCRPILGHDGRPIARMLVTIDGHPPTVTRLWWITHRGKLLQLSGSWSEREDETYSSLGDAVASSIRSMTSSDYEQIQVKRLRIVKAGPEETIEEILSCSHSSWSPAKLALINDFSPTEPVDAGSLIKIVSSEPYLTDGIPQNGKKATDTGSSIKGP